MSGRGKDGKLSTKQGLINAITAHLKHGIDDPALKEAIETVQRLLTTVTVSTVTITGDAKSSVSPYEAMVNHEECTESFMTYIDEDLKKYVKGDTGMRFYVDASGTLMVSVTYHLTTPASLPNDIEKKLIDYTQGQWSDGIGEGWEQIEKNEELGISPWHYRQIVTVNYMLSV